MNIYLDDCMDDDALIQRLRQVGHSIVSPREAGTVGMADHAHLTYAAQHHCTLLTKNCDDFQELHRHWQHTDRAHSGIFLVYQDNNPNKDMSVVGIVRAVSNVIVSGLSIANELHILNHWR